MPRIGRDDDKGLEIAAARGAAGMFGPEGARLAPAVDVKALHARIGELTPKNDF